MDCGASMNQDESIALWRQGKEAWNAWAEEMLRQKAELEKAGTWNGDKSEDEWSDETRKWDEAAQTDLSGLRFVTRALTGAAEKQVGQEKESSRPADADVKTLIIEGDDIDFNDFVFPWQMHFQDAQFHGDADFRSAQFHGYAEFGSAQFHGYADFDDARFHGYANFESAQFHGDAFFKSAQFHGPSWFRNAQFHGDAWFRGVQFHEVMWSEDTQFHEMANFGDAQFHGEAFFIDAQFNGHVGFWGAQFQGRAEFASSNFERSASFRDALFGSKENPQHAYFTAIKADRAFDLTDAQFSKVPSFSQADFKQAPDLDNVSFQARPFWRGGDKDLVPQYRALKRLAVQGHDYEREQMAFKGELRSRRWVIDKWYGPSVWLGIIYDFFADCGRSIWRPFVWWAALVLGFAVFYFSRSLDGLATRCGSQETAAFQALYLSIKNGLVVFGGTRDARVNQAYLCLYGSQSGVSDQLNIPLSVTYVETLLQTPISAVLLFLLLLAVRNQFKIK